MVLNTGWAIKTFVTLHLQTWHAAGPSSSLYASVELNQAQHYIKQTRLLKLMNHWWCFKQTCRTFPHLWAFAAVLWLYTELHVWWYHNGAQMFEHCSLMSYWFTNRSRWVVRKDQCWTTGTFLSCDSPQWNAVSWYFTFVLFWYRLLFLLCKASTAVIKWKWKVSGLFWSEITHPYYILSSDMFFLGGGHLLCLSLLSGFWLVACGKKGVSRCPTSSSTHRKQQRHHLFVFSDHDTVMTLT